MDDTQEPLDIFRFGQRVGNSDAFRDWRSGRVSAASYDLETV